MELTTLDVRVIEHVDDGLAQRLGAVDAHTQRDRARTDRHDISSANAVSVIATNRRDTADLPCRRGGFSNLLPDRFEPDRVALGWTARPASSPSPLERQTSCTAN